VDITVCKQGDKNSRFERDNMYLFWKTAAVLLDHELDVRDLLEHRLQLLYCINTYQF
jgi:hypothetical protein